MRKLSDWYDSMILGVISDTHDDLEKIDRAICVLDDAAVDLIIHCGDWCAPFSVERFAAGPAPMVTVLGNNDGDILLIRQKTVEAGHTFAGQYAFFEHGGRSIAVLHGEHPEVIDALARCGTYDIVFHGHTHERRDATVAGTVVANPGWDDILLYDTQTGERRFVPIR